MKILKITGLLTALLFSIEVWGQSAAAELHFENAEKAYNTGNYKEVLVKLDETEKLTGPMSRTLYLRIVTQDKIFKGGSQRIEDMDFALLTSLRDNITAYLEVMADHGLDERYREVYSIGEGLNKFPKTLAERNAILEKEWQKQKEREDLAYSQAIASDKASDYQNFLSFYPGSERASDIRDRLATARDREAYQVFSTNKTSVNAASYLRSFPNGLHKKLVLAEYEDLLYAEGLEYERSKEFSSAKERFSSYKTNFPAGKHITEVDNKLGNLGSQIERQEVLKKIDNRTYGVFSYATNGTYAIELGRLPGGGKPGLGGYLSGQANGPGFQVSKPSETITAEELASSDEYKIGVIGGSIGLNYYITYPLWIYAGVGISFQPYYHKEKDRSFTLEGRKDLVFFPEFGVKSRVANAIVLKAGIQVIPGGTAFQVGIGF